MPKQKEKFPDVFLACPFDQNLKKINHEIDSLPWKIKLANENIKTDHLLVKIADDIRKCDFALFDITGWNANVCLELGLAKGMGKAYYILNNNAIKADVPSDIKGIERIDYNWNKKKLAASLFDQIKNGIFKRQFISAKIWKCLQDKYRAEEKFILSLRVLSKFKNGRKNIKISEVKIISQGLHFKKIEDCDEVMQIMVELKIFRRTQKTGAFTLIKSIYKGY